jgi:hypothetical protein
MKVSLLCVVILSAISASAQCTHEPVGKPLRVRLIAEDGTPIIVQNAFLNGLRSIPDVITFGGLAKKSDDVVVYVHGFENKDTLGNALGSIWYYRVYRLWHCAGPAVPPMLFEHLDEGLRGAPLSEAEALVREDVAAINVRAFEKLRQEREASHR